MIYYPHLRLILDFLIYSSIIHTVSLISCFCSSSQMFALGFLQIPPRGGHPCHQLWFLSSRPIRDFNPIEIKYAWHTKKSHPKSGGFSNFKNFFFFIEPLVSAGKMIALSLAVLSRYPTASQRYQSHFLLPLQ